MKTRGVETKSESNEIQCWGENPNAQMLRVELRDGSIHLYPYAWLERVQFLPEAKADRVTLFFNGRSVRITGIKLRDLVLAFQRMAVEWVKEQPENFQTNEMAHFVQQIEFTNNLISEPSTRTL